MFSSFKKLTSVICSDSGQMISHVRVLNVKLKVMLTLIQANNIVYQYRNRIGKQKKKI